ncbi:hypothetical protein ABZ904_42395 [Streptomyces sp. NPDC046900]|uniref:hypothetical protein n=1 Tax=Streptomyces sp. NPDC046900 TaxID=3155473 RepID=UPI0033EFE62E
MASTEPGYAHSAPAREAGVMAKHRMIVFPPSKTGGRRVQVDGDMPVRAYSLQDLSVFLERAGIEDWTGVNQMAEDLVEAA